MSFIQQIEKTIKIFHFYNNSTYKCICINLTRLNRKIGEFFLLDLVEKRESEIERKEAKLKKREKI